MTMQSKPGRPTTVVRETIRNPLTQWLESQVGPGQIFSSYNALATATGLAPITVRSILHVGTCTVTTLIALAKATNTPVKRVFFYAGWLAEWDLEYHGVNETEEEILNGVRSMSEDRRKLVVSMVRTLLQSKAI